MFRDAAGEWIVGIKVKINLLQEHLHIAYRQCPWMPLYRSPSPSLPLPLSPFPSVSRH